MLLVLVEASEVDHAVQNLEQQVKSLQDQLQGKADCLEVSEYELSLEQATNKVGPADNDQLL